MSADPMYPDETYEEIVGVLKADPTVPTPLLAEWLYQRFMALGNEDDDEVEVPPFPIDLTLLTPDEIHQLVLRFQDILDEQRLVLTKIFTAEVEDARVLHTLEQEL